MPFRSKSMTGHGFTSPAGHRARPPMNQRTRQEIERLDGSIRALPASGTAATAASITRRAESDFLNLTQVPPWIWGGGIGYIMLPGEAGHPGIVRISGSSARYVTAFNSIVLAGGEVFEAVVRLNTVGAAYFWAGFCNTTTVSDKSCLIYVDSYGVRGLCYTSPTSLTSTTVVTPALNTWYYLRIAVESLALVRFLIRGMDGVDLLNEAITTNIPTAPMACGVCISNGFIADIDYLSLEVGAEVPR